MEKRTRKKENGYRIHPIWKWVIFAVVVIYCGITILSQNKALNEQREALKTLEEQELELKDRVKELQEELNYMDTDEYVERTARDRLGMVKKDEIIFKEKESDDKAA